MIRKLTHPVALSIAGLGFLSAAAWAVAVPFGLAAIGVSLLLIEWRTES
jgi:hypothetical protein